MAVARPTSHPNDLSPSRRKYGKNGNTKVGRLTVVCPRCGQRWSVLYRPRENHPSVCPNCKRWRVELCADARLEDFEISMTPWNIKSDPKQGALL